MGVDKREKDFHRVIFSLLIWKSMVISNFASIEAYFFFFLGGGVIKGAFLPNIFECLKQCKKGRKSAKMLLIYQVLGILQSKGKRDPRIRPQPNGQPEVETNKCCVFPFLRSSGALRGVVKDEPARAEKGNTQHLLVSTFDF